MKTVFLGTPSQAVAFLKTLAKLSDVRLVVTQPARPSGRGLELTPCAVETAAKEIGIPTAAPASGEELASVLSASGADIGIIAAYGRLLKKKALASLPLGFINVHFSLLPKYRGAAPVQWSLINGETKTGVTAFWLDEGMDTGPVFSSKETEILPQDDAASLMQKLVSLGQGLLEEIIPEIGRGNLIRNPQTGEPSRAPMISTSDSVLDFNLPAASVHNRVRGLALGPRARTQVELNGKKTWVQITKTSLPPPAPSEFRPGSVSRVARGKGFFVQCYGGEVLVEEVRPEGKKSVPAWDFAGGFRLKAGDMFC